MSFKLGKKVLIVNDAAQAQLLFFAKLANGVRRLVETDDDFQTTTAFDDLVATPDTQSGAEGAGYLPASPADDETIAQADMLRILGFGDLIGSEITEVIGAKGVTGVAQISTITFTVNSVVVGDEIEVALDFQSDALEGEFASHASDYKRKKIFTLVVAAAETATTLATKLVNDINGIIDSGWARWITVTSAAGVVTLTVTRPTIQVTATFSGTGVAAATLAAAFAVTTAGYGGRNTHAQLKSLRLETVNGPYAETNKTLQVPLSSAKYSSYLIKKTVSRTDLSGFSGGLNSVPSGTFELQIFVNESLSAYILALTKWLNANVARRIMYTSTTAAAVLAGDSATTATTVDATETFLTPLV